MVSLNDEQKIHNPHQTNDIRIRDEAIKMLGSFGHDLESSEGKRNSLKDAFLYMHLLSEENSLRIWLENLIKKSMDYGRNSLDEIYIRRHNTFVKHYILKQDKRITEREQMIGSVMITYDVNIVLDKMIVFAFGHDALRDVQTKQKKSSAPYCRDTINKWRFQKSSFSFIEFYADNSFIDRSVYLGKAEEMIVGFTDIVKSKNHALCHDSLKQLFMNYSLLPSQDQAKVFLDDLIKLHKECVKACEIELLERRHNIFLTKFSKNMSANAVAMHFNTSPTIVYKDINKTIDDIVFLAFGIKQINQKEGQSIG